MGRFLFALVLLAGGCGPEAPYIYELSYSPNAAFINEKTTVNGMVKFSDPDRDASQWVVELIDPMNQLVFRSSRQPLMGSPGTSPLGVLSFTFEFVASAEGLYTFQTWMIDLLDHPSNKLSGLIRLISKAPPP